MSSSNPFTLGVNYPWVNCGRDFGVGRHNFSEVEREFAQLHTLGITVARFWILAGGVNYPVDEEIQAYGEIVPVQGRGIDRLRWKDLYTIRRNPLTWGTTKMPFMVW